MRNDEILVGRSVRKQMGRIEQLAHALMIFCTCGFWVPVYLARKHQVQRTTLHYDRRSA